MQLSEILTIKSVLPALKVANKRQLLQELAHHAAKPTRLDARRIFETLLQRERLLSTGLGLGAAIPHEKFVGLQRMHGLFARLVPPIDFDAVDDQPVDLVFLLLSPESASGDHLTALARISRLFRDPVLVHKLRGTDDAAGLYAILTEPSASTSHAA
jgi:PTS system nitrogen regulatory IIA component